MIRRFASLAPAVLAWSLLSMPAYAGPAEQYESGVRAFQNGRYDEAVTELEASLQARPDASTALYLGNAFLKLGKLDSAKDAFETVLRLEPKHPKRAAIETLIRSIEARAEVTVHVESNPPGARITLDDGTDVLGVTPADLNVVVGRHRLVFHKEGYAETTEEVALVARTPARVEVKLAGKGCAMTISASVTGATAILDQQPPTRLPGTVLVPAGEHKVRITAHGYATKEETLQCDGFTGGALAIGLEQEKGLLTLPSAPGTVVKIDGQVMNVSAEDATKGIGLAPGRHEITVSVGDAEPRTSIVDVHPGEAVALGADKPEDGAFASHTLYFELVGGGNLALRDWKLGSNAFRTQRGATGLAPKSSGMAGLRVGVQISPRFATELEVAWLALPNQLDTSQGLAYDVNLLYHLLKTRWTPVLEGGVGAYQVIAGDFGSDVSARGHLGVGLRGRVGRWFALRADARDVVSKGFAAGGSNNVELLAGAELSF